MTGLTALLEKSSACHDHLCPRQVLGVRIGLLGLDHLGFTAPPPGKRPLVFVETDGCFVDGVGAATDCAVGHRTLRVEDYGKVAAVFADTHTGRALRLAPRPGVRQAARAYAPGETDEYQAQLQGYQVMPAEALFSVREVRLVTPLEAIVSRHGLRVDCQACGEEIINEREVRSQGRALCRACALGGYYRVLEPAEAAGCG
jgi:formylmethanofuran dehydrogenase subunit E